MRGGPSRNELSAKRPSPRWQYRTTVAKFCQPIGVRNSGRRALRHAFAGGHALLEQCDVLVVRHENDAAAAHASVRKPRKSGAAENAAAAA